MMREAFVHEGGSFFFNKERIARIVNELHELYDLDSNADSIS